MLQYAAAQQILGTAGACVGVKDEPAHAWVLSFPPSLPSARHTVRIVLGPPNHALPWHALEGRMRGGAWVAVHSVPIVSVRP